ncbi:hypothetical protein SK36_01809 [Citrobacter sp. MGH106]|nr:hypothetical protein SK36_01809 [Citrobacter sp. MGH106]
MSMKRLCFNVSIMQQKDTYQNIILINGDKRHYNLLCWAELFLLSTTPDISMHNNHLIILN